MTCGLLVTIGSFEPTREALFKKAKFPSRATRQSGKTPHMIRLTLPTGVLDTVRDPLWPLILKTPYDSVVEIDSAIQVLYPSCAIS